MKLRWLVTEGEDTPVLQYLDSVGLWRKPHWVDVPLMEMKRMNENKSTFTFTKGVTEDFEPVLKFSGEVYFDAPLDKEARKEALKIFRVLSKLLD